MEKSSMLSHPIVLRFALTHMNAKMPKSKNIIKAANQRIDKSVLGFKHNFSFVGAYRKGATNTFFINKR